MIGQTGQFGAGIVNASTGEANIKKSNTIKKAHQKQNYNNVIIATDKFSPVILRLKNNQTYDVYPYQAGRDIIVNITISNIDVINWNGNEKLITNLSISSDIDKIDVSPLVNLSYLDIKNSNIRELDIKQNKELYYLILMNNKNLQNVDVSSNKNLKSSYKSILLSDNGFDELAESEIKKLITYFRKYYKEERGNPLDFLDKKYMDLIRKTKKLYNTNLVRIFEKI